MMDLLGINEAAIRMAGEGQEVECYSVFCETHAAYVDDSELSLLERRAERGMVVQVLQGSRLCSAAGTVDGWEDVRRCVERAKAAVQLTPDDSRRGGFLPPRAASLPSLDTEDPRVRSLEAEDLASLAMQVVEGCGARIPRGLLRASTYQVALSNSAGTEVLQSGTAVYAHFTSMLDDPSPGEGEESFHGTHLDLDPAHMGEELWRKALDSARAQRHRGRLRGVTILPPSELGDMMLSSVGAALSAENVANRRSPWAERLGEELASPMVTISDDPRVPGPLCARFDDEGAPAEAKLLLDSGVLGAFLRDAYNGPSTGNGLRRSPSDMRESYLHPVSVKPMNLFLHPGRGGREELVAQTDDGVLVEKLAWPEADPFTGRFALEVRCGLVVKGGEVVGRVKNALLTGNMLEALMQVEAIGADSVCTGNVTVPTVSFRGMELVGD